MLSRTFAPTVLFKSAWNRGTSLTVALRCAAILLGLGATPLFASTYAPTLYVADGRFVPGEIHRLTYRRGGYQSYLLHKRQPSSHARNRSPNRSIGSFVVAKDGTMFVCSGVDLCIYRIVGNREELVHVHFPALVGDGIRDLALSPSGNSLYYSVWRTPQGMREPVSDGTIYGLDIREALRNRPGSARPWTYYRVSQADLGYRWIGSFDVSEAGLYLGVIDGASSVYHVGDGAPKEVFHTKHKIDSFNITGRELYFTDGRTTIYRATDFGRPTSVTRLADTYTLRDVRVVNRH